MKVGVPGSGGVAEALGTGFAGAGHQVMLGTREPGAAKVQGWTSEPESRLEAAARALMRGSSPTYPRIYAVVRRIPRGRVASYGQIARLAGLPGRARQVGYALHALPSGTRLPWHRVINARGAVSPRARPEEGVLQRLLLEKEGVRFDAGGRTWWDRFGWRPRARISSQRT